MSLKRREILVENVASLSGVTAGDGDIINLLGYYTPGDGGGQTLRYSVTASGTANAGSVFDASGIGRFESVNPEELHALHFGFSTTEAGSAARLQAALDWASANSRPLRIPTGDYTLDDKVYVRTNTHLYGDGQGNTTIRRGQGVNWTSQDAIFWLITYTSRTNSAYLADLKNVRVSDMTLDFNFATWQDSTPIFFIDGRGLFTGNSDVIENIEIDHIEFISSTAVVPTSTNDAWCIATNPRSSSSKNLKVHDCRSPEHHQLISAGGGSGWDGVWYYNNYLYHPRDNGMTIVTTYDDVDDAPAASGTFTHNKHVHIFDNVVIGPANYGIWVGVDDSARARGARLTDINIHNNTIIQDAYTDPVAAVSRIGIGVTICESETGGINISNNRVSHTDDVDATTDQAILVQLQAALQTGTIDTAFTQPAVGATVTISFTTDPDYRLGSTFAVGDATNAGGLYEVTSITGGGDYVVTRLRYPVGTADGVSVPINTPYSSFGILRDSSISNNICDGIIEVRSGYGVTIENNICQPSPGQTTRALQVENSDGVTVANNLLKDGPLWLLGPCRASVVGNEFDWQATAAGFVQQKANAESVLSRVANIESYLSKNRPTPGAGVNRVLAQTGAGTHSMSGDFAQNSDPESSVTADVGSTYFRLDGGAGTTFYVKETGTGNTGWVAK